MLYRHINTRYWMWSFRWECETKRKVTEHRRKASYQQTSGLPVYRLVSIVHGYYDIKKVEHFNRKTLVFNSGIHIFFIKHKFEDLFTAGRSVDVTFTDKKAIDLSNYINVYSFRWICIWERFFISRGKFWSRYNFYRILWGNSCQFSSLYCLFLIDLFFWDNY